MFVLHTLKLVIVQSIHSFDHKYFESLQQFFLPSKRGIRLVLFLPTCTINYSFHISYKQFDMYYLFCLYLFLCKLKYITILSLVWRPGSFHAAPKKKVLCTNILKGLTFLIHPSIRLNQNYTFATIILFVHRFFKSSKIIGINSQKSSLRKS